MVMPQTHWILAVLLDDSQKPVMAAYDNSPTSFVFQHISQFDSTED